MSCKNEEEVNTFDAPNWQVVSGDYSESMTAVIELANNIAPYISENDEVAAFIDDECRGVAHQIDGQFVINIKGFSDENSPIVIRYYSARNRYMYQEIDKVRFSPDAVLGTIDHPYILTLTVM